MAEGEFLLTWDMLSRSRVIAKGNRIRDVERLVHTYGGLRSRWLKKSSPPFDQNGMIYEYHWYEHHGIGRVEIRRKELGQS